MKHIHSALLTVQKELDPVRKKKKGHNYNYADLQSVLEACLSQLHEQGVVLLQNPIPSVREGVAAIETRFVHAESGEEVKSIIEIPTSGNMKMNAAQAYGSAITYGRRYALVSMLGIAVEDDDAASAARHPSEPDNKRLAAEAYAKAAVLELKGREGDWKQDWLLDNQKELDALRSRHPDLHKKIMENV